MVFDNVNIDYQNISDGPESGRIYTIDHISTSLVVKTNPGGSIVNTISLDTPIQNEVLSLEYDGFYFYTLTRLPANNGLRINKWRLNNTNTLLVKLLGINNEINLLNSAVQVYDSEAFAVHRYSTTLQTTVSTSSTSIVLNNTTDLSLFDSIYLGPSSAALGQRESFTVIGIVGNTVTLNAPTAFQYNTGDSVIYRKNIFVFNNYNGNNPIGGSLINLDQQNGGILYNISSNEWAQVTAASSLNGSLWFVRNSQLYNFKPIGANSGYLTSLLLNNINPNKQDTVKVFDIIISNSSIQKLQKERVNFNTVSDQFEIEKGVNNRYHLDEEFLASNFKSVTVKRELEHILLGENKTAQFKATALDQYNIPIFSRNLSVTEDDLYGTIEPGFEAIVTNVSGQGITRYNSAVPLEKTFVLVTIRDIITQVPGKFPLEQFDFIDGVCFINQQDSRFSIVPLEQRQLISSGVLNQTEGINSDTFLTQRSSLTSKKPINQNTTFNTIPINQVRNISNDCPLSQRAFLQDITTINQFIFLLFALPLPFSIKNPLDTNILIRIIGFGTIPLDVPSLIFKVNGIDISEQVVVTPFGGGLQLDYNPIQNFNYGSTVAIEISILDTDNPPNLISIDYTFDTIDDFLAPTLLELFPSNNSENNSTDTVIYAIIEEDETSLDLNSIKFFVEGIEVPFEIINITDISYQLLHRPMCSFTNNVNINVALEVSDVFGNTLELQWSFKTRESSDVLFINKIPKECQVFVPVDSTICVTALGKEDGIQIENSSLNISGKDVKFMLKPKVYRNK